MSDLDLNFGNFTTVEDHLNLPFVESVTRVGRYDGTFSNGSGELKCLLMGIDRINFSQVAFFRKDFTEQPVDRLMNDLGLEPFGVLVPRPLAVQNGFRVGDRLLISAQILEEHVEKDLLIVGIYDYFPTIYPGATPTLIVNLDSLFANPDFALGYDLWFKLQERADIPRLLEATRTLIGGGGVHVQVRAGALGAIQESLAQPERVGLFGVLNVGFLVTGLMPGIGFVLYSYASLRRRFIQLGILRAVGLSIEQMIGYLALEQLS